MKKSRLLSSLPIPGYEKVVYFRDDTVQLEGYIAIHSTKRGPALGGTRFWPYSSKEEALSDVLRLAEGMSLKAAAADLPLGGGKAVLIGNPNTLKSPAYFHAYGDVINTLNGLYITAEDMNINTDDIQCIAETTSFVVGRLGLAGNPSPWTALGVYQGVKASLDFVFPGKPLNDVSFAIQGVGETGFHLLNHLLDHGATQLIISDINPAKIKRVLDAYPFVKVVDDRALLSAQVDVLCPCAFGGILNAHTLPQIKAKIIAGSANNLFLDPATDPDSFNKKGILVAPDYVINAAGLMCVQHELSQTLDESQLVQQINMIGDRLTRLYQTANTTHQSPFAVSLALYRSLV